MEAAISGDGALFPLGEPISSEKRTQPIRYLSHLTIPGSCSANNVEAYNSNVVFGWEVYQ